MNAISYPRPNTGNSINDYFSALIDFVQLAPHLLEAQTTQNFIIWFEKLELIDRRSLLLYLRKHKDEISPEYMRFAQRRFKEKI